MSKINPLRTILKLHLKSLINCIADLFDEPYDPTYDGDIIEEMSDRKDQKEAMEKLIKESLQ